MLLVRAPESLLSLITARDDACGVNGHHSRAGKGCGERQSLDGAPLRASERTMSSITSSQTVQHRLGPLYMLVAAFFASDARKSGKAECLPTAFIAT